MPSKIYAFANQKGGVGKTTTAVNLAACLAEAGERALVVDLDPQANATSGLGMRANGSSSYDLLDGAPLDGLARPTKFANLDLVPATPELAAGEWRPALRLFGPLPPYDGQQQGPVRRDSNRIHCQHRSRML